MQTDTAATIDPTSDSPPPKKPLWRRLARLVAVFAMLPYVGVTLLLMFNQRRLIYHPTQSQPLNVADFGFDPTTARDVTLTTDDGLTLRGWLIDAASPDARNGTIGNTKVAATKPPLVIYFPGNAADRANRIDDLLEFTRIGCHVLLFDYRGYAENPGSPTETALESDARDVWRFAVDERNRSPNQIVLFGESLGGAVAISLAETLCQQGTPPMALITNATFDSVPCLARSIYPIFPFNWIVWDRWPSIDRISKITCPLLMFHGTADTIVPINHGRSLYAAAPPRSASGIEKTFIEFNGAGHNAIPVTTLGQEMLRLLSTIAGDSTSYTSGDK